MGRHIEPAFAVDFERLVFDIEGLGRIVDFPVETFPGTELEYSSDSVEPVESIPHSLLDDWSKQLVRKKI